jgi:hypothetical protein
MPDNETVDRARELAEKLAATGVVGEEQAKVYAFRDVFGFGRAETAELLSKNANTVDSLRATANQRVTEARKLIDVFEQEQDLLQVRQARSGRWHRTPTDERACDDAGLVMLSGSREYRVLPETETNTLPGELCPECFSK